MTLENKVSRTLETHHIGQLVGHQRFELVPA